MTDPGPSPRDAAARAGVTLRLLPATVSPDRIALAGLHAWTEDDFPNIVLGLGAEPGGLTSALFTASGKPSMRP
jgi:hypothetical protein